MNLKSLFLGGCTSATWSAWALRVRRIYQYESQVTILGGCTSATWSAWALRVGIYQYESQITIFWGVDLPLDLPELSEEESISMICHLVCLSCQSRNLSVWISNCHFWGGVVLQVQCKVICRCTVKSHLNSTTHQISEYESENGRSIGGRSATLSARFQFSQ